MSPEAATLRRRFLVEEVAKDTERRLRPGEVVAHTTVPAAWIAELLDERSAVLDFLLASVVSTEPDWPKWRHVIHGVQLWPGSTHLRGEPCVLCTVLPPPPPAARLSEAQTDGR